MAPKATTTPDAVGIVVKFSSITLASGENVERKSAANLKSQVTTRLKKAGLTGRTRAVFEGPDYTVLAVGIGERASILTADELSRLTSEVGALPGVVKIFPDYVARPDPRELDGTFSTKSGAFTSALNNDSLAQWHLLPVSEGGAAYNLNVAGTWASGVTGSRDVVMAIVDTGAWVNHPDLHANIHESIGYNYFQSSTDVSDNYGHGTHVAGILGAVGNNAIGVSGVNWNTRILIYKYYDVNDGSNSAILSSVYAAVQNGARVINLSLSANFDDGGFYNDAFEFARSHGVIIVAAAGNSALDNDVYPASPANTALDNVISVAALNPDGTLPSFSNYGHRSVHLAAPGTNILSTYNSTGYAYLSGTSMAAPMVTGAVGLVWSRYPNENYRQIVARITGCVHGLPATDSAKVWSGGALDVGAAIAGGTCTNLVPSEIQNLIATPPANSQSTELAWTAANRATGYIVAYRADGSGTIAEKCAAENGVNRIEVIDPHATVTGLTGGAFYSGRICAKNLRETSPGIPLKFRGGGGIVSSPPAPPIALAHQRPNRPTSATLLWQPGSGDSVANYRFDFRAGDGMTGVDCAGLRESTTTPQFSFSALSARTRYTLSVCAQNSAGSSTVATYSFTTSPEETLAPFFYRDLKQLRFRWYGFENGIRVNSLVTMGTTAASVPAGCGGGRTVLDDPETTFTGLQSNSTYYFRICYLDAQNEPTPGAVFSASTVSPTHALTFQYYRTSDREWLDFTVDRNFKDVEENVQVIACPIDGLAPTDCLTQGIALTVGDPHTPLRFKKRPGQGARRYRYDLQIGGTTISSYSELP